MAFKILFTEAFNDSFKKLTRKNRAIKERLTKKIVHILANPYIGEPKSHNLKGVRGSHVNPYVIVYLFDRDKIVFIYVDHHNKVYARASEILEKIEYQY